MNFVACLSDQAFCPREFRAFVSQVIDTSGDVCVFLRIVHRTGALGTEGGMVRGR